MIIRLSKVAQAKAIVHVMDVLLSVDVESLTTFFKEGSMKYLVLFLNGSDLVDAGFYNKIPSITELNKVVSGEGVDYKIVKLSRETAKNVAVLWKFGEETNNDFPTRLLCGLVRDIVSETLDQQ